MMQDTPPATPTPPTPVPPVPPTPASPAPTPAARRKRRRVWTIALPVGVLVVVIIAALAGYVLSERGLPFLVARIVAQTGGRLSVEAPSGSVAGTMRFRRIVWHGTDATVSADDVVVDWNPGALWSSRVSIRGLGARHVDISIKPSSGATTPPSDLALPLRIDLDRVAVGEIDWRTGPRAGRIKGLEFGYAGDASAHRIRGLRFIADEGSVTGDVELSARAPLTVAGKFALTGDQMLAGAQLAVTLGGTLAKLQIDAQGTLHDAPMTLQATATPFAQAPFASVIATLERFDLATQDGDWPHTLARVRIDARPSGSGVTGTLDASNDLPGPIDSARLPVVHLAARYTFGDDALALDHIDAALAGGGSASGEGRITVTSAVAPSATAAVAGAPVAAETTGAGRIALALRDVDLAHLHTRLAATRLSGRLQASGNRERQELSGDLRDASISLAFAAAVAGKRVDVTRFRAESGPGSLAGSARIALDGAGEFTLQAAMRRLDPSRFAAVPGASLDGTLRASGVLRPAWRIAADATLAPGSRIDGVATSGSAKATMTATTLRDMHIDVAIASATLRASGSAGVSGDRLTFAVDAPRIGELAAWVPATFPHPLGGEIRADGTLQIGSGAIGGLRNNAISGDVTVRGKDLRIGANYAISQLDARVTGTAARHHATLAMRTRDIDVSAALDATLQPAGHGSPASWSGTLASFDNRGAVPVRLRAPASFVLRGGYARLADVNLDAADGRADVAEFTWDHGHVSTRGNFTGIALARAAQLAGHALPFESTLVVGGDWSVAAAPRLTGSFSLRRERGDIQAVAPATAPPRTTPDNRALGITSLEIAGTFKNDALDAHGNFDSVRAGRANATLAIGAVGAPGDLTEGRIDASAPLSATLHAEIAALSVFQPWIGTTAVINGRAKLDATAHGTVGAPAWSGTLEGDELRIAAPQFGIDFSGGRLRARVAPTGIALDELFLAGGDGHFSATGNIALPGAGTASPTQVTWTAERFRVANRPDLRLVVNGSGTLALEKHHLALGGRVNVVDGHVEYDATPSGKLAPDIVVKGRKAAAPADASLRDLPLVLDVDVDLGPALTFAGEGLDTGLTGRIKVTTAADGTLIGRGTINAVNGTYFAFGQKLTIDRGRVIFDGALDNPALDVVALRKNLAVEAGVALTGTVKLPRVSITSNPPVPENEALAWLVTGQGLNASGRADYAALSAASAALLGRGGKPFTAEIAQRFGLDDISLQSVGTSGTQGTTSQVVVLGKRLSSRLTLGYEQGLSIATSALRLEYALSRLVTLRAEAGTVSGVGIVYRQSFQ